MAPVERVKKIEDITNFLEMGKLLETLGISGEGVSSVETAKDKVKEHLDEDKTSNWKAGKGFNVFANPKAQDERRRSDLDKLYTEATAVLHKFGDEIKDARKSQAGKIRELREQLKKKQYVVLVAGETSAGKSSMLNLILGEDPLPKAHLSSTSVICELKYGKACGMVVHSKNKPEPESIYFQGMDLESIKQKIQTVVVAEGDARENPEYEKVELYWPHPLLKEGVQIVDSPGFGESDVMDAMVSQYLPNVFAFIYVINSANAGGVQKDRIIKLLDKVKKILDQTQGGFSSKSALFVFNKWDQIPQEEAEEVKKKTTEMLWKCLPELDPNTQVMHFSTKRAALAQEYGISSREFTSLLDSINSLVTRSMTSRLEIHLGWLNGLIDWMVLTADAFLVNADRSREETMTNMRSVRERLDRLQQDQAKDMEDLQIILETNTIDAAHLLADHMRSASFRERFCSWKHEEGPPADMESWKETELLIQESLQNRLRQLIEEWEEENHVFAEARKSLINRFLSKYQHFERELARLKQEEVMAVPEVQVQQDQESDDEDEISMIAVAVPGIIFFPLNLAASLLGGPAVALALNVEDDHPKVFWGSSPLWAPFALAGAILALPAGLSVLAISAATKKIKETQEKRKIKKYEENRSPVLQDASSIHLTMFLKDTALFSAYAEHLMKPAAECLEEVKAVIPQMISLDRQLYEKLKNDQRSKEEIKETYIHLKEDCERLRSELQRVFSELLPGTEQAGEGVYKAAN